jgi:hypothetical protein
MVALFSSVAVILMFTWTGGIAVKLVWFRLRRKIAGFIMTDGGVYDIIPLTKDEDRAINKHFGHFTIDHDALGWFPNGVKVLPLLEGWNQSISFKNLRDYVDVNIDPKSFDDHIKAVQTLERRKVEQGIFNPQTMGVFVMLFLIIGIVGYMLIGAMGDSACQDRLIAVSTECAKYGLDVANATVSAGVSNQQLPMGLDAVVNPNA